MGGKFAFLFQGKISALNYNIFMKVIPQNPCLKWGGRRREGKERGKVASWLSGGWSPLYISVLWYL